MANTRKRGHRQDRDSPQDHLIALTDDAMAVADTARRHRQPLGGINFYANKMASLRADAAVTFGKVVGSSGEASGLSELVAKIFSVEATAKERTSAARELQFALRTTWAKRSIDHSDAEAGGVFPLVVLSQTRRGYLSAVGRQANGCYSAGWFDASAVMMRRLLESVIIEAFEAKKIDSKIKDARTGDFLQLTGIINAAIAEPSWNLPRNVRRQLPNLRDLGHTSAHNRYYLAKREDIEKLTMAYRETVEAFLHLAGLL